MSQVNIEDFINKHLVKLLWGIVIYYAMSLSNDFKEVKLTLQQMLINQATVEIRISSMESQTKQNTVDIQLLKERHTKDKE